MIKNLLILLSISITIATRPSNLFNDYTERPLKQFKSESSLANVIGQQDHLDYVSQFLECSDCNSLSQVNRETNERVRGFNVPNKLEWLQDFLLSNKPVNYGLDIILNWAIKQSDLPFNEGHDWVQLAYDKKLFLLTGHLLDLNMQPKNPETLFYKSLREKECNIPSKLLMKNLRPLQSGDLEMALDYQCYELILFALSKRDLPQINLNYLFFESLRQNALTVAEGTLHFVFINDEIEFIVQNMQLEVQENLQHYQTIYQRFLMQQKHLWQNGKVIDWHILTRIAFFAGDFAGISMDFIYQIILENEWYEFMKILVQYLNSTDFDTYLTYHRELMDHLENALQSQNYELYMRIIGVFFSFFMNPNRPSDSDIDILLNTLFSNREDLMSMSIAELRPWMNILFRPSIWDLMSPTEKCQLALFDPRDIHTIIQNFQDAMIIYLDSSNVPESEKNTYMALYDDVFLNTFTSYRTRIGRDKIEQSILPWIQTRSLDEAFITRVMKKVYENSSTILVAVIVTGYLLSIFSECDEIPEYFENLIPTEHWSKIKYECAHYS